MEARWWRSLPGGAVRCELCPRHCQLRPGQRGFCFVRHNRDGRLHLDVEGPESGLQLDPVEKKPLFHFLPGSRVLSFGTSGCNLGCRHCQNWSLTRNRMLRRRRLRHTPRELATLARRGGAVGIACTYNDPVIWAEYAMAVAEACREQGLATVGVTAGVISAPARVRFFDAFDALNVDLKSFRGSFYRNLALGVRGTLRTVLDNLRWIRERGGSWLELTTLLIPGVNDSEREIRALSRWVRRELGAELPLHFTAFFPTHRLVDRPPTSLATLRRARAIASAEGLRHVYTGNRADPEGTETRCAGCGARLIRRDGYRLRSQRLDSEGRCPDCGRKLAGRYGGAPFRRS